MIHLLTELNVKMLYLLVPTHHAIWC